MPEIINGNNRDYLQEAVAIVNGTIVKLPEIQHLIAQQKEIEKLKRELKGWDYKGE